jgi:hypothetical protein
MIKVLEENKTVVTEDRSIRVFAKINSDSFKGRDRDNHSKFFTETVIFEGKAVLKDGDADNKVEATRIAEGKMERSYYKYIRACQKLVLKEATKLIEDTTAALARTERNVSKTNSHIEEICTRL